MDIAISSIALVVLILMSYSFAWSHMPAYMVASIVGAIAVAVFTDTALSPPVRVIDIDRGGEVHGGRPGVHPGILADRRILVGMEAQVAPCAVVPGDRRDLHRPRMVIA